MFRKEMTINQILQVNPEAVKLLNQYKLDTCCGGSNTLEAEAKAANADLEELLNKLNQLYAK